MTSEDTRTEEYLSIAKCKKTCVQNKHIYDDNKEGKKSMPL